MPRRQANDIQRIALAHAIGFTGYPSNVTAEPYLNYISNRHIGRGTLEEYLHLFLRVVEHFKQDGSPTASDSIQALLDTLVTSANEDLFSDTKAGSKTRKEDVEDTVMYILGIWTMLLSSFVQLPNGIRKVVTAYTLRAQSRGTPRAACEENLAGLLKGSGLLPAPAWAQTQASHPDDDIVQTARKLVALLSGEKGSLDGSNVHYPEKSLFEAFESKEPGSRISYRSLDNMDSLESLSIKATRLNAFSLSTLGAVELSWTHNISRHMQLSRHDGRFVLDIFALPCVFDATSLTSHAVGISPELAQEIKESYCILFNAWPDVPLHARIGRYLGIRSFCFCWACSSYRYRKDVLSKLRKSTSRSAKRSRDKVPRSEFDPLLAELMNNNESSDWTYDLFPCLWSRITMLEEHLEKAKPWSIWILFRDRRDTLQFWTFLFATVMLLMTLLQVALGVMQVAGSFVK
ncbi:hypothetical protein K505DRAFT_372529 [Melanomma pulvis-pyrius CBS 109.77]|uniref:Uncharacterized protein n=1 Tax=Melanomma pulvis-pyrius CBS 109.77 TaxID=1314802 RepID=A0A6A6XP82_9PLEO|nr:hypothetical protein K505DRAFT_372529 [Melanomma pulvis-pyrius CBS 109.77]